MKTGAIVAIVLGSVVVLGGGATAAILLLRKRTSAPASEAKDLAAAQAYLGPKAVAQGALTPPAAPGQGASGGGSMASPGANLILGAAGKYVDKMYPGLGSAAAGIAKSIDSKVGLGLISKVPGLKKLKFW
jgi:hypothetical protein